MVYIKKAERQRLIKQLIMQQEIEAQDELTTHLEEIGVRAAQATVPRDIRKTSIVKTHGTDDRVKYVIFFQARGTSSEEKLREPVRDSVVRMERVQFVAILHTGMGNADVVSNFLDEVAYPEVAGAATGADTITVITRSEEDAEHFIERIGDMIF